MRRRHKQTDAVQVGGQYRQCNGVRKPIGAVESAPGRDRDAQGC